MAVGNRLILPERTPFIPAALPSSWGFSRFASNPVIANQLSETNEMYNPACTQLANGDVLCLAKGALRIYLHKSTDHGETFAIQNGGSEVIGPGGGGAWDAGAALEPALIYDRANGTIHAWYKGYNSGLTQSGWGHATASDASPTSFTKDPANPILTQSTVSTALSGATVTDVSIGSVVLIGSTFHFYGYAHVTDRYRLIHATGTTWNDPGSVTSILTAANTTTHLVVQTPDVFRLPGTTTLYVMFYADGAAQPAARTIRYGTSLDGATWDFSDTADLLSPTSGWESNEVYSGHLLKVSDSPWALPLPDASARWRYYYSGLDNASHAQSGLAYMSPVWP